MSGAQRTWLRVRFGGAGATFTRWNPDFDRNVATVCASPFEFASNTSTRTFAGDMPVSGSATPRLCSALSFLIRLKSSLVSGCSART